MKKKSYSQAVTFMHIDNFNRLSVPYIHEEKQEKKKYQQKKKSTLKQKR